MSKGILPKYNKYCVMTQECLVCIGQFLRLSAIEKKLAILIVNISIIKDTESKLDSHIGSIYKKSVCAIHTRRSET